MIVGLDLLLEASHPSLLQVWTVDYASSIEEGDGRLCWVLAVHLPTRIWHDMIQTAIVLGLLSWLFGDCGQATHPDATCTFPQIVGKISARSGSRWGKDEQAGGGQ